MLGSLKRFCLVCAVLSLLLTWANAAHAAKNVILMVADGAGWNSWIAGAMYQGKLGKEIYDAQGWVKLGATTYPRNAAGSPTYSDFEDWRFIYDADKTWDATPTPRPLVPGKPAKPSKIGYFAGYDFARGTATDSAAAATAMATGRKTYNNSINVTDNGRKLMGQTIPEIAKLQGKSCGVATTVPWSHATPAALGGAHNASRGEYAQIAREMLTADTLDVIFGAGHPEFDENGKRLNPMPKKPNFNYVGGKKVWRQLVEGTHPGGWKLVQTRGEFESLTSGDTPRRVVGTAQAASTLQANRSKPTPAVPGEEPPVLQPFEVPLNQTVPSLATMTNAALNCLDDNPKGFYLMIEGGAVDWANHANDEARMIEEFSDYLGAVEAVCAWVEKNSSWNDTLLILTSDHDNGLIWGPESQTIPFQPIQDNGPGKMPSLRYHTGGHSNNLVPLYARGAGSERFATLVCGIDPKAGAAWGFSGAYVQNTSIFYVMEAEVVSAVAAAEPAADMPEASSPPPTELSNTGVSE